MGSIVLAGGTTVRNDGTTVSKGGTTIHTDGTTMSVASLDRACNGCYP